MPLGLIEAGFLGTVFEGLFYGIYCVVFVLYLQIHPSKKSDHRSILIYPMSSLFVLCTAFFVLDFTMAYLTVHQTRGQVTGLLVWNLDAGASAFYSFINVNCQGILIYRCWVMWDRKLAIAVIPSILALIPLVASLTLIHELVVLGPQNIGDLPGWFTPIGVLSFSVSLAVTTIFTGLLVFKIAKASLALRHMQTSGMQDFTPLISIIVESGLVLFMVQLVLVICFSTGSSAYGLISGPIAMIYGIMPTTILVRVKMASNQSSAIVESTMEFAFAE